MSPGTSKLGQATETFNMWSNMAFRSKCSTFFTLLFFFSDYKEIEERIRFRVSSKKFKHILVWNRWYRYGICQQAIRPKLDPLGRPASQRTGCSSNVHHIAAPLQSYFSINYILLLYILHFELAFTLFLYFSWSFGRFAMCFCNVF